MHDMEQEDEEEEEEYNLHKSEIIGKLLFLSLSVQREKRDVIERTEN